MKEAGNPLVVGSEGMRCEPTTSSRKLGSKGSRLSPLGSSGALAAQGFPEAKQQAAKAKMVCHLRQLAE